MDEVEAYVYMLICYYNQCLQKTISLKNLVWRTYGSRFSVVNQRQSSLAVCIDIPNIIIKNNKLHQLIDKPTRYTSTSATLLDLVITNKPESVVHHDVVPHVIADHDLISVKVHLRKPKRIPVTRTFYKDDINQQVVHIFNNFITKCLNLTVLRKLKDLLRHG